MGLNASEVIPPAQAPMAGDLIRRRLSGRPLYPVMPAAANEELADGEPVMFAGYWFVRSVNGGWLLAVDD